MIYTTASGGWNTFSFSPHSLSSSPQEHSASARYKINIAYKDNPRMFFASVGRQGHVLNSPSLEGLAQVVARSEIDLSSISEVVAGYVYVRHRDGRIRVIRHSKPAADYDLREFLTVVSIYRDGESAKKQRQAMKLIQGYLGW